MEQARADHSERNYKKDIHQSERVLRLAREFLETGCGEIRKTYREDIGHEDEVLIFDTSRCFEQRGLRERDMNCEVPSALASSDYMDEAIIKRKTYRTPPVLRATQAYQSIAIEHNETRAQACSKSKYHCCIIQMTVSQGTLDEAHIWDSSPTDSKRADNAVASLENFYTITYFMDLAGKFVADDEVWVLSGRLETAVVMKVTMRWHTGQRRSSWCANSV